VWALRGGVAPPSTLLIASQFAGGFAPGAGGAFFTEIIYDDNETINNYPIYNSDTHPPPGGEAPRELRSNEQRGWRRNAPQ
jgi:hypothetical protein